MNFLPGRIVAADSGGLSVRLGGGALVQAAVDARGVQVGADVTLGVRPEHLVIAAGDTRSQAIDATTGVVERFGECTYLHATVGEGRDAGVVAKLSGDVDIARGRAVALHVPPDACHVFDADGMALPRLAAARQQDYTLRSA